MGRAGSGPSGLSAGWLWGSGPVLPGPASRDQGGDSGLEGAVLGRCLQSLEISSPGRDRLQGPDPQVSLPGTDLVTTGTAKSRSCLDPLARRLTPPPTPLLTCSCEDLRVGVRSQGSGPSSAARPRHGPGRGLPSSSGPAVPCPSDAVDGQCDLEDPTSSPMCEPPSAQRHRSAFLSLPRPDSGPRNPNRTCGRWGAVGGRPARGARRKPQRAAGPSVTSGPRTAGGLGHAARASEREGAVPARAPASPPARGAGSAVPRGAVAGAPRATPPGGAAAGRVSLRAQGTERVPTAGSEVLAVRRAVGVGEPPEASRLTARAVCEPAAPLPSARGPTSGLAGRPFFPASFALHLDIGTCPSLTSR